MTLTGTCNQNGQFIFLACAANFVRHVAGRSMFRECEVLQGMESSSASLSHCDLDWRRFGNPETFMQCLLQVTAFNASDHQAWNRELTQQTHAAGQPLM